MGIGVSGWTLARAVSMCGHLGVVAGTSLDVILIRKLQDGDIGGNIRRALKSFPFQDIAERILDKYFVEGGKPAEKPYKPVVMSTIEGPKKAQENIVAANFVEVFLAKENHDGMVGVNYLEKVKLTMLPAIYGALLAGVTYVIIGAGIPTEIPGALDNLAKHKPTSYPTRLLTKEGSKNIRLEFDPAELIQGKAMPDLERPQFLPIIASAVLGKRLLKTANGEINGFVIEGSTAGGHNAPPRGVMQLTDDGQPVYGDRDAVDLEKIKKLGLPFWVAGSYGSKEGLQNALDAGAAGIQVGTAFAFCKESGLADELRNAVINKSLSGDLDIFTSPKASPTGFPFKVAKLPGTLTDVSVYNNRKRVCDLGYLREAYEREDGSFGYLCSAEAVNAFVNKGGKQEETKGRMCICNALAANIGLAQRNSDGDVEPALITCGNDGVNLKQFIKSGTNEYSAADVIDTIVG